MSRVDLHLHTTASDGHCSPDALVALAASMHLTVMGVTDHDTVAAVADVRRAAAVVGIEVVPGIEITAIEGGRDVHVLGYFVDPGDATLGQFLESQRAARRRRVEDIADRLAQLGKPIDAAAILTQAEAQGGRSIGRPQIARAMVAAGHVASLAEAFDKWLATGKPAFMPRDGALPVEVFEVIHRAGGLASLAHPGQTNVDGRIPAYVAGGLDAIEAHHPDHDPATTRRYLALASRLHLLVTGGSDFHGDPDHGGAPGDVTLPSDAWLRLRTAAHG